VGDPFLTTGNPTLKLIYEYGIEDGDAWIDRDGHDLYLYDADANEWVSSDVLSHASTHHCAGSDPIDVKDICDTQGYRHLGTKAAHDALGLSHSSLSGVSANQHHNRDHKATHSAGGADPLDVKDLADVLAYLHKHLTALSECPHGDDDHIENYAKNPHTHASHGGVLSRGQIGFGADVGCELPVGIGAWSDYIAEMEIADTTLYITALHVACDTTATPSASVSFVFSLNGTEIGTVTLTEGNSHAALNIEDVALSDADRVKIAWPADRKGATGFCAYAVIERRGVEEE